MIVFKQLFSFLSENLSNRSYDGVQILLLEFILSLALSNDQCWHSFQQTNGIHKVFNALEKLRVDNETNPTHIEDVCICKNRIITNWIEVFDSNVVHHRFHRICSWIVCVYGFYC